MNKQQLENILRSIFSIFIMIAIAGGVIVFLIFLAAMIMGGKGGEAMASNVTKTYMPYFIKASSIAVLSGLLLFYLGGTHALSLKVEKKDRE